MADVLRVIAFGEAALIFGAWVLIMGRSFQAYRQVKRSGGDADLRLHIWLITLSYLIFVSSVTIEVYLRVGEPVAWQSLPAIFVGAPIGLYALWLFMRPRRIVEPDARVTTLKEN